MSSSSSTTTTSTVKKPSSSKPPSPSLPLITIIPVAILLLLSPLFFHHHHPPPPPPPPPSILRPPPHPLIKHTCTNTLYPSLCLHTLSSIPLNNHTQLHHLLQFSIHKTLTRAAKSRSRITKLTFNVQEIDNCIELLDQTIYELQESIKPLYGDPPPYAAIKNLLSAAMTNENTCIDGFSDNHPRRLARYFQKSLTPIMRMISNCLAIVNFIENSGASGSGSGAGSGVGSGVGSGAGFGTMGGGSMRVLKEGGYYRDHHVPSWMTAADRRLMQRPPTPTVVVAMDGSGNFTTIGAAVAMSPNRSVGRYVIQIKAGMYYENVVIPRQKINIMLVGDGMNSTIITGSRNFVDGYTTFTSATLSVIGNNFLARDLTIINTSGPEKHQAVALRVTSDAAFYHCQFISHQDTLYAHSLSQLYRECAIHGTVDFIFGNAAAIFERCLILVRKPIPGQKNVITAQGRLDPNQNTGISLQDCTIMAAPDFSVTERSNFSTFLGRPWRNYSRTIVMRSYLGDIVDPRGWCAWNKYSNLDTVDYIEYMNFGPGADTTKRVQWSGYHNNSTTNFTIQSFLHGANEWLKTADLPICNGLYVKDCKTPSAQVY